MIDSFKVENCCFGKYVEINEVDIFDIYYNQTSEKNYSLDEETKLLKRETLKLLMSHVDEIDVIDWEKIIEIVAYHEGFDTEHDSDTEPCECCGTYSTRTKGH